METTTISTAALPFSAAPIVLMPINDSARLRTPALPIEMPLPIDTAWRRVAGNGGALLAAGYTHALTAKQVDRDSVAKQAGPPRGSRLVG